MRARVFVTLKPSVFDPQGKTIADALHSLGYSGVEDVRQGKYFELDLATTEAAQAQALAAEVADKLLAMARFSPIMKEIRAFAARGGPVLGICNGFQVLLEAGLLPGAMLRNRSLKFQCEFVHLRIEQTDTPFTCAARKRQVLKVPIAHGEGNYFAAPDVVADLEANRQVIFRYTTADGRISPDANPNGSVAAIAGLCNQARNVVGLMPHPERACEPILGSADGRVVFESVMEWVRSAAWRTLPLPALQAARTA